MYIVRCIHRPYLGTLCALNIFILARAFAPAPLQFCATGGSRRAWNVAHTCRKDGGFQKLKSCVRHTALRHAASSNAERDRSGSEATIHASFNLTSARISERECSARLPRSTCTSGADIGGFCWQARLAGMQRRLRSENIIEPTRLVSRHKLSKTDGVDYAGDSLFSAFAQVVCELDGVVPRKELHEAWEAAVIRKRESERACVCAARARSHPKFLNTEQQHAAQVLIHEAFPSVMRVADLASGNGLLSWALMVMDKSQKRYSIYLLCQ